MPTEWIRRTFCIEKKRKKMLGYRRSQLRNERQKKRERGTERGREEVGDKRLNKSLSAKNVWCSSWLLRCIQRGNGREYFEEKQIMVQKFNEPYYVRRFGFPRFFYLLFVNHAGFMSHIMSSLQIWRAALCVWNIWYVVLGGERMKTSRVA